MKSARLLDKGHTQLVLGVFLSWGYLWAFLNADVQLSWKLSEPSVWTEGVLADSCHGVAAEFNMFMLLFWLHMTHLPGQGVIVVLQDNKMI